MSWWWWYVAMQEGGDGDTYVQQRGSGDFTGHLGLAGPAGPGVSLLPRPVGTR
jgi:hypothetical protein